jgi:hypothetical protein
MSAVQFRLLTGRFYRIAFAADGGRLLEGARSPEGRFHRSGQPAFYLSPRPDWAAAATRVYRRPGDEPRIVAALDVTGVHIVDLRDVYQCRALAIDQRWPSVPWRPQRAAGDAATTWPPRTRCGRWAPTA